MRTQPLICVGCSVPYWVSCGINKGGYAPINVKHLIVSVGPWVGHLTDLVLPGEGIFESFFAQRGDI